MNRAEATRQVLLLEAARDQLDARAKALREGMNADAVAEYEEQGSAQTWRFDIGTWSQGVSREAPVVADPAAFAAWVKDRYPTAVIEQVVPAFQKALLASLDCITDFVIHPDTGEVVPGLGVRPGGRPLPLRFKPKDDALAVADQEAGVLVEQVAAALGITDGPLFDHATEGEDRCVT